jgi:hypothetical protein
MRSAPPVGDRFRQFGGDRARRDEGGADVVGLHIRNRAHGVFGSGVDGAAGRNLGVATDEMLTMWPLFCRIISGRTAAMP